MKSLGKHCLLPILILAIPACGLLTLACPSVSALPFGKGKEDEDAPVAVPKIKLSKEQQDEYDTSLKNGNAYLAQSNFELALICFLRCKTLNPQNPAARVGIAYCYAGQKKNEQAHMEIIDSLQFDSSYVPARFLWGELMMSEGRWDEAGGQFLQVLKNQPDNLGARGNLGTCLQMMGQPESAAGQFKYILEKDPKNAMAAYNLAAVYEFKGMADDAAQYYKKTIEIDPKNANAYCSLAKVLMAKKDFKAAQVLLDHVRNKLGVNNHFLHLIQGLSFELQNQRRPAIEEYTKAVALSPNDADAQRALQRMLESNAGKLNKNAGTPLGSGKSIGGLKVSPH